MSFQPHSGAEFPPLTARVARVANPKGTTAMWIRDRLDGLWRDEDFTAWYPRDGCSGLSPAQLATVRVLQYAKLSSRAPSGNAPATPTRAATAAADPSPGPVAAPFGFSPTDATAAPWLSQPPTGVSAAEAQTGDETSMLELYPPPCTSDASTRPSATAA